MLYVAQHLYIAHQCLQVRICFDTVPSAIERCDKGHVISYLHWLLIYCRSFWGECEQANEENEVAECQQCGKLNSCG